MRQVKNICLNVHTIVNYMKCVFDIRLANPSLCESIFFLIKCVTLYTAM